MKNESGAWFLEEKNSHEAGRSVVDWLKCLRDDQLNRRIRAQSAASAYYGRTFNYLSAADFIGPSQPTDDIDRAIEEEITLPLAQSILQTAKAKIASKQRPKGCVLTKGANYRHRIQAKKLSKFHEAILHQRQGKFANSWDMGEACFMDALRWEAGVAKVYADVNGERIAHERCYPYDIFVDEYDAEFGTPKSLGHLQRFDRYNLAEAYPKMRAAIMGAEAYPYDGTNDPGKNHNMVAVYEAWRLPFGKNKPGRHIIALDAGNTMNAMLVDEEWKRESFPFAWILWDPNPYGMFSTPLIETIQPLQEAYSELFNDAHENVRMHGGGYTEYEEGAYDENDIASNAIGRLIKRKPGTQATLNTVMPQPLAQGTINFIEMVRGAAYELSGVSELAAQGRKESGIDAAVAIRTMNDLQSERFLPQARAYENFYVQLCRLDIEAAQELMDAGISVSATLPNEGFLNELDFGTIRMPSDMYEVTIQASSANDDTLAARKQLVSEMAMNGQISPETAKELLASPNVDVEALGKRELAQKRYLEQLIGQFEEYDAEKDDDSPFESPDPMLNLEAGIMQMTDAYIEFLADGAPEENRGLIREWITQADKLIADRQAEQAPPEAPMGPGGPPGGMPMEEMGPEMMGGGEMMPPPEMMPPEVAA